MLCVLRIFILAFFVFKTHISIPLCNADWNCSDLLLFFFLWAVCVCVVSCRVLLFFSRQTCVFVFFSLQEMLRPHESKMCVSLWYSSSVEKQTLVPPPCEICPAVTSGLRWGSAQGQWSQVKVHQSLRSDSSNHPPGTFSARSHTFTPAIMGEGLCYSFYVWGFFFHKESWVLKLEELNCNLYGKINWIITVIVLWQRYHYAPLVETASLSLFVSAAHWVDPSTIYGKAVYRLYLVENSKCLQGRGSFSRKLTP